MYLLDTNTVSDLFRNRGRVGERLRTVPPKEIAVSVITLFELRVGIIKAGGPQDRFHRVQRFMTMVNRLDFGDRDAMAAATLRVDLERAGKPIGPLDTLLAGTALAHGATFVTRNVREFARIKGLKVENWY